MAATAPGAVARWQEAGSRFARFTKEAPCSGSGLHGRPYGSSSSCRSSFKGKSLNAYSASTGVGPGGAACTVEGKSIVITYGTSEITFTRKRSTPVVGSRNAFARNDTDRAL